MTTPIGADTVAGVKVPFAPILNLAGRRTFDEDVAAPVRVVVVAVRSVVVGAEVLVAVCSVVLAVEAVCARVAVVGVGAL